MRTTPHRRPAQSAPARRRVRGFVVLAILFLATVRAGADDGVAHVLDVVREGNGDIRIVDDAGTEVFRLGDFDPASDFKPVDTDAPVLSANRTARGWTVLYENCCTSYPIPTVLVVYRAGGATTRIENGMMI